MYTCINIINMNIKGEKLTFLYRKLYSMNIFIIISSSFHKKPTFTVIKNNHFLVFKYIIFKVTIILKLLNLKKKLNL